MLKIIFLILLLPSALFAAMPVNPSYVSPDAVPGSTTCTFASPCPLTYALSNVAAGDTVYLQGGTYNAGIILTDKVGTAANKITFAAYTGETPVINNTTTPSSGYYHSLLLSGSKYIKLSGITFEYSSGFFHAQLVRASSYNEIDTCIFDGKNQSGAINIWKGSSSLDDETYKCVHNWIHHCTIKNTGELAWNGVYVNDDGGFQLGIYMGSYGFEQVSGYTTIENNTFYCGGHHNLETFSKYNVIRNNFFYCHGCMENNTGHVANYGADSNSLWGNRNLQIYDGENNTGMYNIIEGNRFGPSGPPPDDDGGDGLTLTAPKNIIRHNSIYSSQNNGLLMKIGTDSYSDNNRLYNNNIVGAGRYHNTGPQWQGYGIRFYPSLRLSVGNVFKNNILYGSTSGDISHAVKTGYDSAADNTFTNNWLNATGNPSFIDGTLPSITITPSTTDPNFNLFLGSGAIDQGISLTTVHTGDIGSGNSLILVDALYFQAGSSATSTPVGSSLSNVQGDWILVGATVSGAASTQITDINYSTNTLTISPAISRADGDKVWLYKKSDGVQVLYGTAPDYGAFEYGSAAAIPIVTGVTISGGTLQ